MKKLLIVSFLIILSACSKNGKDGLSGAVGDSGLNGLPGSNGHSAVFSQSVADISLCSNGGTVITAGVDLNDNSLLDVSETKAVAVNCNGLNGSNGLDGTNGQDGQNGHDGADAPATPFTPVAIVSACGGDINNPNNEVFIRMSNGTLIGTVSENVGGLNTHLGVVAPGAYISTGSNGSGCNFTVNLDGSVTH